MPPGPRYAAPREKQREVYQQRGRNQQRANLGPVHLPVEGVELASVMERRTARTTRGRRDKSALAPAGRSGAAHEDEEANAEIQQADHTQVRLEGQRLGRRRNHQARVKNGPATFEAIVDLGPDPGDPQTPRDFDGAFQRDSFDAEEPVACVDSGLFGGAARRDIQGAHPLGGVHPRDAVVRHVKRQALLQIDDAEDDSRSRQQSQHHGPES